MKKVFFALLAAIVMCSCAKEEISIEALGNNQEGIVSETQTAGETEDVAEMKPFETIKLKNGNELKFFHIADELGEDVLVLEEGACSDCSGLSLMDDEVTALDIYWAFSEEGKVIPTEFGTTKTTTANQTQGWGKELLTASSELENRGGACNNSSFRNSIAGGFLPGTTFVRYDKSPSNYSNFKSPVYVGNTAQSALHYYNATYTNTKRWRGKVCGQSTGTYQATYHNGGGWQVAHLTPRIMFQRKYTNSNNWQTLGLSNLPSTGVKTAQWYVNGSSNRNFRVHITFAKENDVFDIMMDKD